MNTLLKDSAFVTTICNTPIFIEYQYKTLKKFLKQSFDLYVVDDCNRIEETRQLIDICNKYQLIYIKCPEHPSNRRNGGDRHMNGLNAGLKSIPERYKYIGILDGDMFLIKYLNLDIVLEQYDVISHMSGNGGVTYFWPGIVIWKAETTKLHQYYWDGCYGITGSTDTGGTTYKFILANPHLKINCIGSTNVNFDMNNLPESVKKFLIDDIKNNPRPCVDLMYLNNEFTFFHYRAISNWMNINKKHIDEKLIRFYTYMNELL